MDKKQKMQQLRIWQFITANNINLIFKIENKLTKTNISLKKNKDKTPHDTKTTFL